MTFELVDFTAERGSIDGLWFVTMKQITDDRGTIRELFRRSAFASVGIDIAAFVQLNVTESRIGAVRGMHGEEMTKLCAIASGEAHGAWVDLRPESPTFGVIETRRMVPGVQVLIPAGVANGFQSLTDPSQYVYCFDVEWAPDLPGRACSPDDARFGWPLALDVDGRVSVKDRSAPTLADLGVADSPT